MSPGRLSDHIIICGATPVALIAAECARKAGLGIVVLAPQEPRPDPQNPASTQWRQGDPADDTALIDAGIRKAYGLVCALDDDREGLFVTATARYLNRDLRIVACASSPDVEEKLQLAGANNVVCSSRIIGLRMASEMIRPVTVELLDAMLTDVALDPRIEHIDVPQGSVLEGKLLREAGIISRLGLIVAGIGKRGRTKLIYDPPPSTPIEAGDVLVVLGKGSAADHLRALLAGETLLPKSEPAD